MSVRCGHKAHDLEIAAIHYHYSVADVRECYRHEAGVPSIQEEDAHYEDYPEYEYDADAAYERHLEGAGYWEARADEEREIGMGIDPFNPLGPAFGLLV